MVGTKYGLNVLGKKKEKSEATFESATETPTFAGTNKPIVPGTEKPVAQQPQTTGVYNKEKGGYVTPTTTYPTSNPDFVPAEKGTIPQIKFNNDNSVDYTPTGGEAIKLTKEEYKAAISGEGIMTNKVKEAQVAMQPKIEQIPLASQTIEQQASEEGGYDLKTSAPVLADSASIIVNGFDTLAGLVPGVGKYLRIEGKSDEVKKAEQSFNDMNTVLGNDIAAYKMGQKSKAQVKRNLDLAMQATLRLHAQTKGQGQANLGYWVDKGASIEAELERQKSILDDYIIELNTNPGMQ